MACQAQMHEMVTKKCVHLPLYSMQLPIHLKLMIMLLETVRFQKSPPPSTRRTLSDQFKRYLTGEDLTTDLMRLKALLEMAQPSSAESERAFSAAGLFLTKVRSRLSDESLNMLCFLKHRMLSKAG